MSSHTISLLQSDNRDMKAVRPRVSGGMVEGALIPPTDTVWGGTNQPLPSAPFGFVSAGICGLVISIWDSRQLETTISDTCFRRYQQRRERVWWDLLTAGVMTAVWGAKARLPTASQLACSSTSGQTGLSLAELSWLGSPVVIHVGQRAINGSGH